MNTKLLLLLLLFPFIGVSQTVNWYDSGAIMSASDNGNAMHVGGGTIEKRDGAGNVLFTHTFPFGPPFTEIHHVASNSSGRYVVIGSFLTDIDVDFSGGTTTLTDTPFRDDYFYAVYDATGNLLFAESFYVLGNLYFADLIMDEDGTPLISGTWEGTLTYNSNDYASVSSSAVFAFTETGFNWITEASTGIFSAGITRGPMGQTWLGINSDYNNPISSSGLGGDLQHNGLSINHPYGAHSLLYSTSTQGVIELIDSFDGIRNIHDVSMDQNGYLHVVGGSESAISTTLSNSTPFNVLNQGQEDLIWGIVEPFILQSGTPASTSSFWFIHSYGSSSSDANPLIPWDDINSPFRTKIITDGNTLTCASTLFDVIDFMPGSNSPSQVIYGDMDAVIYRFSIDGGYMNATFESVMSVGGADVDQITSFDMDANGDLYLGLFGTDVDIDPSPVTLPVAGNATIVKYNGATSKIEGLVYYDLNNNGTQDAGELGVYDATIEIHNGTSSFFVSTDPSGYYAANVPVGTYTVSCDFANSGYFAGSNPPNYVVNATAPNTLYPGNDFGLDATPNINDLSVIVNPLTPVRPGFVATYELLVLNNGTTTLTANASFNFDNDLTFISASTTPLTQSGNNATWTINNMLPGSDTSIIVDVQVPPTLPLGILILSDATVDPTIGDEFPFDNSNDITQISQGSYDPNDKNVNPRAISPQFVADEEYLNYLIRFQNTGTDTAFNVIIRDTLDINLQYNTLEIVSNSDSLVPVMYYDAASDRQIMEFKFPDILLPDSTTNEPESHGFVSYRVKLDTSFTYGDLSCNTAHIYFDYNAPIVTNTVKTKINEIITTDAIADPLCNDECNGSIQITPTGGIAPYQYIWSDTLQGQNLCAGDYQVMITDSVGNIEIITYSLANPAILDYSSNVTNATNGSIDDGEIEIIPVGGVGPYEYSIDGGMIYVDTPLFTGLPAGDYTLCLRDSNGCVTCQDITVDDDQVGLINLNEDSFIVYPNPTSGTFKIQFSGVEARQIQVIDNQGRIVYREHVEGVALVDLDISHLSTGMYTISIQNKDGEHAKTHLLKQ